MSAIKLTSKIEIGAVIRKGNSIYKVVDIDNSYIQPRYVLEETSTHNQIKNGIESLVGCTWSQKSID